MPSHNAENGGSLVLSKLISDRRFPFPKSLYAVEDTLRFFVAEKPDAKILDFFSGSGTTAHAVMRLNKQDGGERQCIQRDQQRSRRGRAEGAARGRACGPAMPNGRRWGICDYITKPRVQAAITGKTPDGKPIKGDYKFTDEFPMAEGFEENAEFFTLTYETPVAVSYQTAFARIAPLLWLRAGSVAAASRKYPPRAGMWPTPTACWWSWTRPRISSKPRARPRLCGSLTSSPTTSAAFRRWRVACPKAWRRSGCTSPT